MKTKIHKPTKTIARKVLATVDKGLSAGLGERTPGHMCVEAAVCFAFGLPHGDDPPCVGAAVRAFKIGLNDSVRWGGNKARAKGLRRVAIAQLGSDQINQKEFAQRLAIETVRRLLPTVLRKYKLEKYAKACANVKTLIGARKAADRAVRPLCAVWAFAHALAAGGCRSACASSASPRCSATSSAMSYAYAANAAGEGSSLYQGAELAVQILIEMNCPGTQWLDLAPRL